MEGEERWQRSICAKDSLKWYATHGGDFIIPPWREDTDVADLAAIMEIYDAGVPAVGVSDVDDAEWSRVVEFTRHARADIGEHAESGVSSVFAVVPICAFCCDSGCHGFSVCTWCLPGTGHTPAADSILVPLHGGSAQSDATQEHGVVMDASDDGNDGVIQSTSAAEAVGNCTVLWALLQGNERLVHAGMRRWVQG